MIYFHLWFSLSIINYTPVPPLNIKFLLLLFQYGFKVGMKNKNDTLVWSINLLIIKRRLHIDFLYIFNSLPRTLTF